MQYDIVFVVSSGIGNVLEMLYSVEYVLHKPTLKVGIYVEKLPSSFIQYLDECYPTLLIHSLEAIKTKHLIHSMTVDKKLPIPFEHYFYIKPDQHSSSYLSETEQALSLVKALYPGGQTFDTLARLKSQPPLGISLENIASKTVLYPGCSSINPSKRWPYFQELVQILGEENIIILGGKDDLDFSASYIYPRWISSFLPQTFLNQRSLWTLLKKGKLLEKYAHWDGMEKLSYTYIEKFSWPELVWIFQHAKLFIGNDGGLTHLAAASGSRGLALFGPTSVEKNKPINPSFEVISKETPCSPCQFGVAGIQMTKGYINCPYQIKCLGQISPERVAELATKK